MEARPYTESEIDSLRERMTFVADQRIGVQVATDARMLATVDALRAELATARTAMAERDGALRQAYSRLIHHAAECARVRTPEGMMSVEPAVWHESRWKDRAVEIRKDADAISAFLASHAEKEVGDAT